jgi:hypothetical protein
MNPQQEQQLKVLEASYKEYRDFQFNEFSWGIKVGLGCAVFTMPFLMIFKDLNYTLIASAIVGAGVFLLLLLFASYKHFMHCRQLDCSKIDVVERHIRDYPHLKQFVTNQVKKNGHLVRYDAAFVALASEQYRKQKKLDNIAQQKH